MEKEDKLIKEFFEDLGELDAENVVFNWECSSSLGD